VYSHAVDFSVGRRGCVCQVVGNVAHGYYNCNVVNIVAVMLLLLASYALFVHE